MSAGAEPSLPPAPPEGAPSLRPPVGGFRLAGPGFVLEWGAVEEAAPLDPAREVPRLREQTAYPVFLRATGDLPVALEARDPVPLRALRRADGGRVVHGAVDFGAQVGTAALAVRVGDGVALRFSVEVAPTKLDYEDDYRALVADTEEIAAALALEYLRAAVHPGLPAPSGGPSRLEWALLLRHAMDDLEAALARIARRPHAALAPERAPARAERVRRPDAALRRAVGRGAGAGGALRVGDAEVRERVGAPVPRDVLDTPEHRWLAAQLRAIRRRLDGVRSAERARPLTARQAPVLAELDALRDRLARAARLDVLAAAAGDPPPGLASPRLLHAPGYREAHRACRLLSLGLRVRGGPAELALKDLHLLYEQWCWLALVRAVAGALGEPLPAAELLVEEGEGLRVRLRRGWGHALRFPLPDGGRVVLAYNPLFAGRGLLVPQRPDIVLEVHRPGRPPHRVVLDAKYRLDSSPAYVARYGAPGPPEDALNTLHRYRDALGAAQAIALFPGRDEDGAFRGSRLWGAIEEVGVGAVPVLPGRCQSLDAIVAVAGWLCPTL